MSSSSFNSDVININFLPVRCYTCSAVMKQSYLEVEEEQLPPHLKVCCRRMILQYTPIFHDKHVYTALDNHANITRSPPCSHPRFYRGR